MQDIFRAVLVATIIIAIFIVMIFLAAHETQPLREFRASLQEIDLGEFHISGE